MAQIATVLNRKSQRKHQNSNVARPGFHQLAKGRWYHYLGRWLVIGLIALEINKVGHFTGRNCGAITNRR